MDSAHSLHCAVLVFSDLFFLLLLSMIAAMFGIQLYGIFNLGHDSWTLCMHAPPEKIRNLRYSNCWKYIQTVNAYTTMLFLYHFKSFTIASGGPYGSWEGGGGGSACAPRALPAYGLEQKDLKTSFSYR